MNAGGLCPSVVQASTLQWLGALGAQHGTNMPQADRSVTRRGIQQPNISVRVM